MWGLCVFLLAGLSLDELYLFRFENQFCCNNSNLQNENSAKMPILIYKQINKYNAIHLANKNGINNNNDISLFIDAYGCAYDK